MRRRKEALVRLYSAAPAGVAGVLPGMQNHPEPGRECRGLNTSQFVVFSGCKDNAEYTQLRGSHLEWLAGREGAPFDLGASDGGSGAECRVRAVGLVCLCATPGVCEFR